MADDALRMISSEVSNTGMAKGGRKLVGEMFCVRIALKARASVLSVGGGGGLKK